MRLRKRRRRRRSSCRTSRWKNKTRLWRLCSEQLDSLKWTQNLAKKLWLCSSWGQSPPLFSSLFKTARVGLSDLWFLFSFRSFDFLEYLLLYTSDANLFLVSWLRSPVRLGIEDWWFWYCKQVDVSQIACYRNICGLRWIGGWRNKEIVEWKLLEFADPQTYSGWS